MKTKYQYGEFYDIHPTDGLDIEGGTVQILGVMHAQALPDYIDTHAYSQGDEELEYEVNFEPWYCLFYPDNNYDEPIYIPQFVLDELIENSNKK